MFSLPLYGFNFPFDFSAERPITNTAFQSYQYNVRAVDLMGKSPEYVSNYVPSYQTGTGPFIYYQYYQQWTKKQRTIATIIMCGLGVGACLWLIYDANQDAQELDALFR